MQSEDRRVYNPEANDKYDIIGKSAAIRLIEFAYPEWIKLNKGEQYKRGDLFYDTGDSDALYIAEAEARSEGNWYKIYNRKYSVRIPNGKNPHKVPACEWNIYVQTGENHEDEGLFFDPGALVGAKIEKNIPYKENGKWKKGTFVYPHPDAITFYKITDGKVNIIP